MKSTSLGIPQKVQLKAMGRSEVSVRVAGGGVSSYSRTGQGEESGQFSPSSEKQLDWGFKLWDGYI